MVEELLKVLLLSQVLGSPGLGQVLKGYHFLDNQLDDRFGPENGYATFNTGNPIPDQVGKTRRRSRGFFFYVLVGSLLED